MRQQQTGMYWLLIHPNRIYDFSSREAWRSTVGKGIFLKKAGGRRHRGQKEQVTRGFDPS
jgi:hypothetical protein